MIDEFKTWFPKSTVQFRRDQTVIQRTDSEWIMNVTVSILGKFNRLIQIEEVWTFVQQTDLDEQWMTLIIKQKTKCTGFAKLIPKRLVNMVLDSNANGVKYWLKNTIEREIML